MIRRHLAPQLLSALADTPVVLLHGARQTGKTTLVRELATTQHPARYLTLDEPAVIAAATSDPHGFVEALDGPVVIDEVQRVPELALALKTTVDRHRKPGRFLLTGSANVLAVPRLSESLAGRMEILRLWPFSQGELDGTPEAFIEAAFAERLPAYEPDPRGKPLLERIVFGGYPEVQTRPDPQRRRAWFDSYVNTILQRDIRDLANIEGLTFMPRLLALLATRVGSLMNYSDIARSIELPQSTLKRYLALLESAFLVQMLPPWSSNLGLRLIKSPKLYLTDTGLLTHLLGTDRASLEANPVLYGHVLENFVICELRKQASWSRRPVQFFHYRKQAGREVDVLMEDPAGQIVGIEIKAGRTIAGSDLEGLRQLAEAVGARFQRGILLYGGDETVAFGKDLCAMPIASLWRTHA